MPPTRGRTDPRPIGIVRGAQADIVGMVNQSITGGLATAVHRNLPRATSRMLRTLGEVFSDPVRDSARRVEIHRQVGAVAQRSVLNSYGQLVTARESPASRSHYRAGGSGAMGGPWVGRLAGGVLRRALGRGDFFLATPDGIGFINERMLDDEAAHWRRIAFGAGPRGQGLHASFGVQWSGVVVAAFGLDVEASRGFEIPRGVWVNQGEFYPIGEMERISGTISGVQRRRAWTRGIEGKAFLATGIERLATELPKGYESYYREIWAEFKHGVGPLNEITGIVPPRPARQRYRSFRIS